MTLTEIKEIKIRLDRAHREICDLAQGKKKWNMTIPPEPTDSDMILQAPLDDLTRLIQTYEATKEAGNIYIDELRAKIKIASIRLARFEKALNTIAGSLVEVCSGIARKALLEKDEL